MYLPTVVWDAMSESELSFAAIEETLDEQRAAGVSENVVEDIVHVSRGNVIANEAHTVLSTLAYSTGWFEPMTRYVNTVAIGPSSGGKTQMQKCAKSLLPSGYTFSRTKASGTALLESDEWDFAVAAPMDEYDKISTDIQEFMKSMAGEDEGMSHERTVSDSNSKTDFTTATLESNPMPFQFLYATDSVSKAGLDNELANRMVKLYVEDNVHIRQAIARKNHGHEYIEVTGYDHDYIYDTTEREASIREHIRRIPTQATMDMQTKNETVVPTDELGYEGRRGTMHVYEPTWVYYATRPIYNFKRTYVNRVSNQVANLMAASTLLNYKHRETTHVTRDGTEVEAYVMAPQDVGNVLSCQPTLLATTHRLDPRKRAALKAVNATSGLDNGEGGWTTLDDIREWLDENDKPTPSEGVLRSLLKDQLKEDWFIRVNEGAGTNGADLFKPRRDAGVQTPLIENLDDAAERLDDVALDDEFGVNVSEPFADVHDPFRNQPFTETVAEFDVSIAGASATHDTKSFTSAAMGGGTTTSGDTDDDGQTTLTDETTSPLPDVAGTPEGVVEEFVYEGLRESVGAAGEPFATHHNVAHWLGIVATTQDSVLQAELSDTVLDPNHELWDDPTFADDRITDSRDALNELQSARYALEDKGILVLDESETPDGFHAVKCQEVDE